MFKDKLKLKQKIKLVSDPSVVESDWLPVCLELENLELVKATPKSTAASRAGFNVLKVVSLAFIFLSAILPFVSSLLMSSFVFALITGFQTQWYMTQFSLADHLALPFVVFGAFGLWGQLTFPRARVALWLLTALLLGSFAVLAHSLASAIILVSGLAAVFAGTLFAKELATAIPKSFKLDQAIISTGAVYSVFAAITVAVAIEAGQIYSTTAAGTYSPTQIGSYLVCQLFAILMVGAPSLCIARIAGTRSFGACIGMNLFLQAPLLVGLSLYTMFCGALVVATNNNNAQAALLATLALPPSSDQLPQMGGAVILSSLSAMVTIVLWSLLGSYFGVSLNRHIWNNRRTD